MYHICEYLILYHYIVSYVFCIEISIVYLHIHLHNDRKTMYLRDVNKNVFKKSKC